MSSTRISVIVVSLMSLALLAACGGAETRMARAMENGQAFLTEKNFEKARIEFSNALQIDPNNADAMYFSGVAAEGVADYRPAVRAYQNALNIDPMHAQATAALARVYLFSGLPEQALEMVVDGLAAHPDDVDLLTVKAAANSALGNEALALEDAERVVRMQPDHEQGVALLAGLYRKNEEFDKAIELARRALELLPNNVDLHVVLAQLHQAMGDLSGAEAELRAVIALQPENVVHRNRLAEFFLTTARSDAAKRVLEEIVTLEPDEIQHKVSLVNYLRTQESYDAAEAQMRRFVSDNPQDQELHLALGEFYQVNGYLEDAEEVYRDVIAQDRLNAYGLRARNRLSARMVQSDRADEAQKLLDEVLTENPRDNDALILRASIALADGETLQAITDLRSVLRDQPESSGVLATLARAHVQNGEPDLARENYRRAVEVDPSNNATRLEYAQYLGQLGESAEAERLLDASLSIDAADVASLETLFKVRVSSRNFDGARDTSARVVELLPEHPLGYYLSGQLLEIEGKQAEALAQYETSLEKSPRAAEPLGALIRVLVKQGDRDGAKRRLRAVATDAPDHSVAHNLLAEILLSEGAFAEALASADRAILSAPAWWVPYRTKAMTYAGQGDTDATRRTYVEGMAATSNAPALGLDLAALLERTGKQEEAIDLYERLHRSNPGSEIIANNLAMLLATYRSDTNSFERAFDLVRGFRTSQVPSYLNTYGWVRFKQGNFDEAVSYLQRAVTAAPNSPIMRYHLGMALLERGDAAAAQQELQAAVEAEQAFPGKDEARRALQFLGAGA